MEQANREPTQHAFPNRRDEAHDPLIILESVHPDEHNSAWLGRPNHVGHGPLRIVKVMKHADREDDVELVAVWELVGAGECYLGLRKLP